MVFMVSWKLFSIAGIDIKLHWTTLLLLGLFLVLSVNSFLILLLLFISITFHELSHSLVAKGNGVKISQIILLPIGGMAVMKNAVIDPKVEFKMAIAGPLFNFAVCGLILIAAYLSGSSNLIYSMGYWNERLAGDILQDIGPMMVSSLFWLNFLLGAFNLFFPALPLDGGRVLRALLAMVMDYVKATRIATVISMFLTILLFLVSLVSMNLILLLISIFIFFGARSEMEFAVSHRLLRKIPVSNLMRKNFLMVDENTPLDALVADMIASRSLVAFSKEGKNITAVSIYKIGEVPKQRWGRMKFKDLAVVIKPVSPGTQVVTALTRMGKEGFEALPVVDNYHEVVGCLYKRDIDTILELLKVTKLS
ncbi:MAG: CBS domain-containing protein [Candidatus Diapherotrites archaeon]|nr:CBS domain-containing protein [Candidatus Diapherotrites archaeon]